MLNAILPAQMLRAVKPRIYLKSVPRTAPAPQIPPASPLAHEDDLDIALMDDDTLIWHALRDCGQLTPLELELVIRLERAEERRDDIYEWLGRPERTPMAEAH
jgi:hypothetical protein